MKRSPTRPNTLKHLPFFEVLASVPEGSPEAKLATAGLLTLRMIDHWVLAGPAIVEPESVSVRSVRNAIMALPTKEPVRESLLTIVNTMQMLRHVDLIPVLPRTFAYAKLLEQHHGALALAGDAYESVVRLADPESDAELSMDAQDRLAFCQRRVGALESAEDTARSLIKMATRRKDRARALRGKMSLGVLAMIRGDLVDAEVQLVAVCDEAKRHGLTTEFGMATHNRAVVASRSGRAVDAMVLAHQALKIATEPTWRDRVLSDLAAFLIKGEQHDAAIDALRILELTAVSDEIRQTAKANLLAVAVRIADQRLFESARRDLEGVALSIEVRVNTLIETARGLELFGTPDAAAEFWDQADAAARAHSLGRSIDEIQRLRGATPLAQSTPGVASSQKQHASEVADDLRRMAAALVVA